MLAAMSATADSPGSPAAVAVARNGGDACPGTLRLHTADDGALARVRIPGGVLTAARARTLLDAAERLGDGELHLTSRGNVQLRGLGQDCGGELAELLREAGLLPSDRHERARNVVASPLSGLDTAGRSDIRPWLDELDALLCASERATALSGRFLFALDDGRGDVDALGADLTLIALDDGQALLRIGPGDTGALLPVAFANAPRAALLAAEAFLDLAAGPDVWRISGLPGAARAVLPAEAARRAGLAPPPEPLAHRAAAAAPGPGAVTGPGGRTALHVGVPMGRLTGVRWRALVETAERLGSGELRCTPWRGVVVPGLAAATAREALDALAGAGLVTGPGSPWAGVGACVGRPGCAKSLADVRAEAEAALGPAGRLPVYWSGCERRCGHPRGEWIDVLATPDGHRITHVRGESRGAPTAVPDDPAALAAAVAAARDART
ncbi:precorrin-3B synthase [Streptomyces sp. NBC_00102]|uniref:precorrin-3B synthase n=1 Tax=Streptomyces sp. NBC_00102 TaxID=2975652 RepID=UPI002258EF4C|nr:precorrin-3B synthase [Streptomyces sp. NBC_00102]MCX5398126.1 precorrin-3B synthase [Streptomyces sp. NBC_00102]